ncbi:hypothetical protein, partial [Streptomyces sp. MUM 2J]|uniref:hypothetical protein n=2 Tax=unclassified Streptomyces TaxID=2593676 RepID=UPI001F04F5A6
VLRAAESRAAEILAEARRQGAADADAARSAARVRARRTARARELAARRECWQELCRQVVEGVQALHGTAAYPALRDRLAEHVRRELGARAHIAEAPGGGVTGRAPGRRIDCSLAAVARRTLEHAGVEVEELWAP